MVEKEQKRGKRKVLKGVVKSDKMNKTRVVVVERFYEHPKFGKYYRKRTVCYVHDEKNVSHKNDIVEIMETRPLSRLKRWRLVKVLECKAETTKSAKTAEQSENTSQTTLTL
jgi:small subunit ribosomal protein S17